IEMILLKDGERITGTYMYPRVGKDISLTGTIDKDGNVNLTEADETGKQTGIFKGKWKSAFDSPDPNVKEIEGKWSRPDGSKETEFMVSQQPIEFNGSVKIVPKVIKEANKDKRYTVEAEYPQIDGDARFEGFNREARNLISKDVAAFKTAETSADAESVTDVPSETQNSTLEAGYDFRYATDDLISVEWNEGTYSRGAAHGNSLTQVLNYDVKKAKKLALADLFTDKSKYLTAIANYCMKELKERAKKEDSMIMEDQIEPGAGPRADNYRAWAITKKGLWITFDPYQVAAYAAGPQYILVPYSALKDIIKPDGPIANFAK
ncbi:MAG TPA: RsiV family protein, partial [Pyrinomonadaceae bacterium]|nr:RsiV family protein [Pyrinomonadaceae bacterium]